LRFRFVLDRIVHLPVPSEIVSRRGKKISEIFNAEHAARSRRWDQARNAPAKIKKMDSANESAEIRETSEETMDATSAALVALCLPLSAVAYVSAIQIAV